MQGRTQGLEQGRTQGLEQGIAKSVRALLHKGKTTEEVAELLDLTVEYVRGIQEQFQEQKTHSYAGENGILKKCYFIMLDF